MYTQCPQCLTIYEIDEDALQASLGIVRCGHCSERFDALRTLSDTLPASAEAALPEHATEALAPTLTEAIPPEAIEAAAARRPRKRADPATATIPTTHPVVAPPLLQAEITWFAPLAGERARALIADAAGIPQDAIQGDPAWQVTDLPTQLPFAELDGIPDAPDSTAPNANDEAPASDATPVNEERIHAAAESEPFTERWSLDIPDADTLETRPSGPQQHGIAQTLADTTDPQLDEDVAAALFDDATEFGPSDDESITDAFSDEAVAPDDADLIGEAAQESPDAKVGAGTAEPERDEAVAPTPVYVPPRRRRVRRSDGLWAAGCLILVLALAAQIAWAQRVALVRAPATQAWALHACASLGCRLPLIRDVAKLELLSRDIRPDPGAAGALMITATVRNDAAFRQPWPVVVVELTDLDNDVVAMRRFRPVEYMPDPVRRTAGIAPGTTAAVAFEVADPGKRAVSFHFGFE